jgi:RNA polymerase sigma-70 factor (ECF subfamily)
MHRARATFAPGGAVLPWMYTIARHVHLDHLRAVRMRPAEELRGLEGTAGPGSDVESTAIAAEEAHIVERVLARLPASQREAFVLLRYEGLSVEDAALVVGTTQTALKLRAFRAYEALRAALEVPTPSGRPLRGARSGPRSRASDPAADRPFSAPAKRAPRGGVSPGGGRGAHHGERIEAAASAA